MARLVTRNCKLTICECMFVDTESEETAYNAVTVEGNLTGDKLVKAIKKQCETDTFKFVKIVGEEKHETELRAVTAEWFMANSFKVEK